MPPHLLRETTVLFALSLFLGLAYNSITEKGIFGSAEAATPAAMTQPGTASSEIISIESAKQLFDEGDALFIDTRHAFDFKLGHISGAINIPFKLSEAGLKDFDEPKNRTLVVYCDGAECNSSLEVGGMLIMAGYTDVRIFFSGWRSWTEMEYPTEGTES
jgi:rhodanese-related sulfurtransferase